MQRVLSLSANLTLALLATLAMVVVFGEQLSVPPVVQVLGRAHPLLLHLPIGLTVVLALLPAYGQHRLVRPEVALLLSPLLHIYALLSVLTALAGQLLAAEGGYPDDILRVHRWTGTALAALAYGSLLSFRLSHSWRRSTSVLVIFSLLIATAAGHWGARLTHGDDFLLAPLRPAPSAPVITDSTPIFAAVVEPILQEKCRACHNENKRKGELVLTTRAGLLAGGENGPLWDSLAADGGQLLRRLHLPLDHDDHMPPAGKPQLTADELALLQAWIQAGADLDLPLAALPADHLIRAAVQARVPTASVYPFAAADAGRIAALQSPYRSIRPLAAGSPALSVTLRLRDAYSAAWIQELQPLAEQIVELDLAQLPVRDEDLAPLADFIHLERLNLNGSGVTGPGLDVLRHCRQLQSLAVSGTPLEVLDPELIGSLPRLQSLYLGDSRLPEEAIATIQRRFPDLYLGRILPARARDTLQLNPPLVVNRSRMIAAGEAIALRHFIRGATIRYTLDGSEPDSSNGIIYTAPFGADSLLLRVRARAFSPGWHPSETIAFSILRRGLSPDSVQLLSATLPRMGRGALTLYDGEKGENDPRGPFFLAYGNQDTMRVRYFLPQRQPPRKLLLSYLHNPGFQGYAPEWLEIRAGDSPANLRLVQRVRPNNQDSKYPARVEAMRIDLLPGYSYRCVEVVALARRPAATDKPDRRPKLYVDEVVFYGD